MKSVAEFEKVSFDDYKKDFNVCYEDFLGVHPEQVAMNIITDDVLEEKWRACFIDVSFLTRGKAIVYPNFKCDLQPGEFICFNTGYSMTLDKDFSVNARYQGIDKNLLAMVGYFTPDVTSEMDLLGKPQKEVIKWYKKHSDVVKLATDKSGLWVKDLIIHLRNNGPQKVRISKTDPIELSFSENWCISVKNENGETYDSCNSSTSLE